MSNKQTTETTAKPKRRTTPKWAGTPGYANMSYGASKPTSKFNESLFDNEYMASADEDCIFSARR